MSNLLSHKKSLFGLLVTEIALNAIYYGSVIVFEQKLVPVDPQDVDIEQGGRKGSVFHHEFVSAFEKASFVLWALEIAQPVELIESSWQVVLHPRPGELLPYFQLRYDIGAIADVAATRAMRPFPSLDYVLGTYLNTMEQFSFRAILDVVSQGGGEPVQLPEIIDTSVPDLTVALERAGYLVREATRLTWTEAAAPALQGNWYALQGGDVGIVDGRPQRLN